MVLRAVSESATINWRQYYSTDHNGGPYPGYRHPPTLIIRYAPAPATYVVVPRSYAGPTPEEAMAAGRSAKTRFLDAYYPDDLTDQELVEGMYFEEDRPPDEIPPDPNPLPEEDTTPPVVSGTTPSNGQTGVPIGGAITAVFDEPVTDAQSAIRDAQGVNVAGTTTMDATDTTLTFTPGAALTPATVYTAEVSGAKDYPGTRWPGRTRGRSRRATPTPRRRPWPRPTPAGTPPACRRPPR
ncbi:Ig-like domain-containing protein [Nonomuraea jabiensis]|uniref:Ig-like domain-containing protein n=1 Tax=Nonomuraea jabiensis TaxID=882448 RepID=UPI003D71C79A